MNKETREHILFGIAIVGAITAVATVWYQRQYFKALGDKTTAEIEAIKAIEAKYAAVAENAAKASEKS